MQQDKGQAGGSTLAANAARHHVFLILACLFLGVAAGTYLGESRPVSYTSSSSVLINPTEGNPYAPSPRNDELVSLETEAQIAQSDFVLLNAAAQSPGSPTLTGMSEGVQVVIPTNTQILQISYTAGDPLVARETAQAIAEAFLENRRQRSENVINAQVARIEAQTEDVIRDLRAATAAAQLGDGPTRAFQSQLSDALNAELVSLRAQRTTLENASPRPGRIIFPANLPPGPSLVQQVAFPVGGGVAGLVAGFLLAMLIERRRGLVRSRRDIEALGLSVLTVPEPLSGQRQSKAAASQTFEETIRRIRSTILDGGPGVSTIAVGSCSERGEPGVAPALASSLARAGRQVVVVDANTAETDSDRHGNIDFRPGLTDLLSGDQRNVESLLETHKESRLRVLPSGRERLEGSDYFVPDRLTVALASLTSACEFVVLRTPNLLSTQGEALSRVADLTILVVVPGETRLAEVRMAVEHLHSSVMPLMAVLVPSYSLPRHRGRTSEGKRRGERGLQLGDRESARSKAS